MDRDNVYRSIYSYVPGIRYGVGIQYVQYIPVYTVQYYKYVRNIRTYSVVPNLGAYSGTVQYSTWNTVQYCTAVKFMRIYCTYTAEQFLHTYLVVGDWSIA